MRKLKHSKYRGLGFGIIQHKEVNADLRGAFELDIFSNKEHGDLIYYDFGFKIRTSDFMDYLSDEDLKDEFVNLRLQKYNIH